MVLKAFGGHKGDITSLTVLLTPLSAKLPPFVISTGGNEQDHTIAIWKLDDEVKEREEKDIVLPDIMLNANEAVKAVCVGAKSDGSAPQDNAEVIIGCVSTSGFFHAFEFDPASKRKKNKAIRAKNLVKVGFVFHVFFIDFNINHTLLLVRHCTDC